MSEELHHSVGIIVTNPEKSWFYFQQKCENYPFPEFRLCYSLWGGTIETKESDSNALERELKEELELIVANIIFSSANKVFDKEITSILGRYMISVYDSILSNDVLGQIAKYNVKEGKAGVLIPEKELRNTKFIFNLEKVIFEYVTKKFNY